MEISSATEQNSILKKRLIISAVSLLYPGSGQYISGEKTSAWVFAFLRFMPFLLVTAKISLSPQSSAIEPLRYAIIASIASNLFCSFDAWKRSLNINKQKKHCPKGLIIFVSVTLFLNAITFVTIKTFFIMVRPLNPYPPLYNSSDRLIVNKLALDHLEVGDLIWLKKEKTYGPGRLVTLKESLVKYDSGVLIIDRRPLNYSIIEKNDYPGDLLTDAESIILEQNMGTAYPIIKPSRKAKPSALSLKVYPETYLVIDDDRSSGIHYSIVKKENIMGRIEGVLYSDKIRRIKLRPEI